MYAIFRKAYHFTKDEIGKNKETGIVTRTVVEQVRIQPSQDYQQAPDWIKTTDLFKHGKKDKMIVEVVPVEVEEEDENKPATKTPKPSGWGAGLQGQQTGFKTQQ